MNNQNSLYNYSNKQYNTVPKKLNQALLFVKPEFADNEELVNEVEEIIRNPKKYCKKLGINLKPNYKVIETCYTTYSKELAAKHYEHLASKPFFGELVDYMGGEGKKVYGIIVEGDDNTIEILRGIVGATKNALPGTIRHDIRVKYGYDLNDATRNVIHCSDSFDTAKQEIELFRKTFEAQNEDDIENA